MLQRREPQRQIPSEGKRQMLYLGRPQDRTGSPPAVLAPQRSGSKI
ncbi:MAG: hypothetical protein HC862_24560 [Scytonema sp. RU_4_4]|nr:hypothetical protein [Scytonema sp. RU_4_4]